MKTKLLLLLIIISSFSEAQIITIADANFKIKLLGSSATNGIAKNLSGVNFKIDTNDDGEIQQSEANNVSELNLSLPVNSNYYYITSAIGITDFNNLTKLNLQNNRIVNLNISGMQFLNFIDCANNAQYLNSLTIQNLPVLETLNCQAAGSNTSNPIYSFLNLPTLKNISFNGCRFYENTLDNITSLENIIGNAGLRSTVINLNLSNKPNLKIVELNNNKLSNITLLSNNSIEELKLASNTISTFNKALFTNLKKLDLSWNRFTALDVSNMTALIELNCDNAYSTSANDLTSLNVQGCTNLIKLICSRNVISDLNLNNLTNLNYLDCYGNENIFTQTGLQTIHLKNCINLKVAIAHSNPYITELDLSCSNTYSQIRVQNCTALKRINLKNGANESAMYAGLFSYESCPNLTLIAVDFNENFTFLPATIQQSPYFNFTPNCTYNTVIGNVKFDIENDGCQNNNGIEGIKIHYNCTMPDCYTFSDTLGNFILYTQNNSVSLVPQNDLFSLFDFGISGPINLTFTPTNIVQYVNLCLAANTIHNDLEIAFLPMEPASAGFDTKYKIVYKNIGNQVQSGTVSLTFDDAVMDLVSSNPVANFSSNNLNWSFSNFLPFETRTIDVLFNINSPTETPPITGGSVLNFSASIIGSSSDENPSNNTSILNQTAVNSYDPNNKICLEGIAVSNNTIGNYVHYVINFENNGTANARNIVVRDVIDTTKFNIATLVPAASSSNVLTRIVTNNVVEFIFENINLPFNDANNDGFIAFKIKTKSTLVPGNSFSNAASIYFDYNYPILTNNFISTIQNPLEIQENELKNTLIFYPNPIKDILFLKNSENVIKVEIYDLAGRILISKPIIENKIDLSELKTGNYIIKVYTDSEVISSKIIKE